MQTAARARERTTHPAGFLILLFSSLSASLSLDTPYLLKLWPP